MDKIPTVEEMESTIREWAVMMRIADWDIDFAFSTHLEIKERTQKDNSCAVCTRNRLLKQALIEIDAEHHDTILDWRHVLAHEMFHIVTDDFHYHASCCLDFVPQDSYDTLENQVDMYYERLVDDLAKCFVASIKAGGQPMMSMGE